MTLPGSSPLLFSFPFCDTGTVMPYVITTIKAFVCAARMAQ